MTNSPTYDQQLAIEAYWRGVDPLTFLPGSINAADRFARVSFLINAIPTKLDPNTITAVPEGTYENQAVASVLSVMRSIGVPLGVNLPSSHSKMAESPVGSDRDMCMVAPLPLGKVGAMTRKESPCNPSTASATLPKLSSTYCPAAIMDIGGRPSGFP